MYSKHLESICREKEVSKPNEPVDFLLAGSTNCDQCSWCVFVLVSVHVHICWYLVGMTLKE